MRLTFCTQNNSRNKIPCKNIDFRAGLTPKMIQEIKKADILEISDKLAQNGIVNDFNGNKILAWCCDKTVEIFQLLNKQFGLNLGLPKEIYVEDFTKLNVDDLEMYGFCNLAPFELRKSSDEIIPSRVVFFNSLKKWENIDLISNRRYKDKLASTDFFLDIPFHEFIHSAHEDRLLDLFDGDLLLKKLQSLKDPKQVLMYQQKYGQKVSTISQYALNDPLDAVACDLSKRIANSIDKDSLIPVKNPFAGSPYQDNSSFIKKMQLKLNPLNEMLKNFWNGTFE